MVRHISIFTFKNVTEKESNIQQVRTFLEKLPTICPLVKKQIIATPAAPTPALPEDAPTMFGDLVHICDFASVADADAYPMTEGHIQLTQLATPLLQKVTVIDYTLQGE